MKKCNDRLDSFNAYHYAFIGCSDDRPTIHRQQNKNQGIRASCCMRGINLTDVPTYLPCVCCCGGAKSGIQLLFSTSKVAFNERFQLGLQHGHASLLHFVQVRFLPFATKTLLVRFRSATLFADVLLFAECIL